MGGKQDQKAVLGLKGGDAGRQGRVFWISLKTQIYSSLAADGPAPCAPFCTEGPVSQVTVRLSPTCRAQRCLLSWVV